MSEDHDPNVMQQQEGQSRRRGKARERIRRRKQRTQMAQVSGTRISRHLAPADSFKVPTIQPRVLKGVGLIVGALLFMVVLILAVGLFKDDPVEQEPNAFFLGPDWSYRLHEDDEVSELVDLLRQHRIGQVYVHVSELNFDNTWTGLPDGSNRFVEVEAQIAALVAQLRQHYPELELYGVLKVRSDADADGYRLDELALQDNVGAFSGGVVGSLGFDGVLLDVQPVWDSDENFLRLLRAVRDAIGEEPLLAVMTPPDWTPEDVDVPVPNTIAPGTVWTTDYKRRVGLLQVDMIVLRGYESYFAIDQGFSAEDYTQWLDYQVETYIDALAYLENDTRLMVALSNEGDLTMQDTVVVRDTEIETLQAAITGVIDALAQVGDQAAVFRGIALVDSATTDSADWQQFRRLWVTR